MENVAPQPVFNPATNTLETPSSVTTSDPSTSSSQGASTRKLSKLGIANYNEWRAAEEARLAAMNAEVGPTIEDFDASMAANKANLHPEDQAAQLMAQSKLDALPDPFESSQPNAYATVGGKPVAGVTAPDPRQRQMTLAEVQDKTAAFKAEEEQRLVQQKAAEMQKIEEERARRSAEWLKQMDAAQAQYERDSKITSLHEDRSTLQNILSAFAVGLGAYGAGLTGGPNHAQQMLQFEMAQDLEKKKIKAEAALNKLRQVGASQAQIDSFAEHAQARLLAMQAAQLAQVDSHNQVLLSRFPQAQAQARQVVAAELAKVKDAQAKFAAEHTGTTADSRATNEGEKRTVVNSLGKGEEGKTAGQAVVSKNALEAARQNQHYLDSLDEEEFAKITQAFKRGEAAAEHTDEGFKGGALSRGAAALSEGVYDLTGGILGTPSSGFQAARLEGGEEAEAFISRDQKATSAVVGLTNPRAAANPQVLEQIAKKSGSAVEGISLEEARRRAREKVKVLESEVDRQAKPLAKIEANAAKRVAAAAPPQPATPQTQATAQAEKKLTGKALTEIPEKLRALYTDAKRTPAERRTPEQNATIQRTEARYGK